MRRTRLAIIGWTMLCVGLAYALLAQVLGQGADYALGFLTGVGAVLLALLLTREVR